MRNDIGSFGLRTRDLGVSTSDLHLRTTDFWVGRPARDVRTRDLGVCAVDLRIPSGRSLVNSVRTGSDSDRIRNALRNKPIA